MHVRRKMETNIIRHTIVCIYTDIYNKHIHIFITQILH